MPALDHINKDGTKYEIVPEIAPLFNTSTAYAKGDCVIKDAVLYRFKTAHSAGSWNSSEVDAINLSEEVTNLKQDLQEFPNGNYPNMTAGNAEQLVSTVFIEDEVPYNFRTSGGSADIGDREYDVVTGVSMPINQYVDKNTLPATTTVNGVTYTNNGDGSITVNGTATDNSRLDNIISIRTWSSHKYLLSGCPSGGSIQSYSLALRGQGADVFDFGSGAIWDASVNAYKGVCIYVTSGTVSNLKFVPQFTDLTLMLGTTIADYVYGLETATAGSGITWLKTHFPKIFDAGYIPYNAGEMQSVTGLSAHKMTGFNQWDEQWELGYYNGNTGAKVNGNTRIRSKNKIPILPNTSYFFQFPSGTSMNGILFYDAEENYLGLDYAQGTSTPRTYTTPANAHYLTFQMNDAYGTTYNHDICINLHWDGERDGEYEEYEEYEYALDDSLTLRGILKLDSSNSLYADGDKYLPDGTVQRLYGVVDLGDLDWVHRNEVGSGIFASRNITDYMFVSNVGAVCAKYEYIGTVGTVNVLIDVDKEIAFYHVADASSRVLYVKDSAYTDAATFKTAMSGVYLVYELATPTTETAEPYQTPQIVDDWGTEEYVSTSLVPVGHYTKYAPNLRAKLEMAPESPAGNGDYIVRQTNGENEYVALGSTTTIQNILDRLTALENA